MTYKEKCGGYEKCPVKEFCESPIANRRAICEKMPSYEELEEEWDTLMDIGVVDPYDCC
jgi:hypothetical protein